MYDNAISPLASTRNLTVPTIDRTKRIKEAKAEAQKEIEEYRSGKEDEYKKFEGEVSCRFPRRGIPSLYKSMVLMLMIEFTSTRADIRRPRKMPARRPRRS